MTLQNYAFPDGSINPLALLEQQCLVQTLYENQRAVAQTILDNAGGGSILAYASQPATWPPSWSLCRQGNTLIFSVAGTVNTSQWAGDVIGVFAVDYPLGGCKVHSFFYAAFLALKAQASPFLPLDAASCDWKVCGHSYGGAVALLWCLDWLQSHPMAKLQLFGSAAPKALTFGFTGTLPHPYFVIQNGNDLFPTVPPNGVLSAVSVLVPAVNFGIPIGWTQYANGVHLNSLGSVVAVTADFFEQPLTAGALVNTITEHYLTAYMQAIAQTVLTYTNSAYAYSVVAIAVALIRAGISQTVVENAGALATVDVATQNVQTFLSSPNGPLTNGNLRTVQSGTVRITTLAAGNSIFAAQSGAFMGMKITFFYAVNLAGFSETHYVSGTGTPSTVFPVANAVNYLTARLAISGVETVVQWVRVSSVGNPRIVQIYTPSDLTAAGLPSLNGTFTYTVRGTVNAANSDFGGTALLMRKFNPSAYSRFFLRGIPDFMIERGGIYNPSALYIAAVNSYVTSCVGLNLAWKAVSGQQPGSPALITGAIQNADGTVTFTTAVPVFNALLAPANQNVAVTIRGQVVPRYINGPQTVTVLTATTCRTLRPLPLVGFQPSNGKMRVNIVGGYPQITGMEVERIVKRGPGRPFGLYRGRQPNRQVA